MPLAVLLPILVVWVISGTSACKRVEPRPAISRQAVDSVLVIGWDGTQREHLLDLLRARRLPHLHSLLAGGSFVSTEIREGATETKPGWAQIFTGYNSWITGVLDNTNYRPIPAGYTVFERLEERLGDDNIETVFIGGKVNNIAARGPHEICINCIHRHPYTRDKTLWWRKDTQAPVRQERKRRQKDRTRRFVAREGEPYLHASKVIDTYEISLGTADRVAPRVMGMLDELAHKKFLAFFHFEEPDEVGHRFDENSQEYSDAIMQNDVYLGEILAKMDRLGLSSRTAILITTDHGMDEGEWRHRDAPHTFVVANLEGLRATGDRRDFAPTLFELFSVDVSELRPRLSGRSLFATGRLKELARPATP